VSRQNWQRPLPRPLILPDVPLKLSTLADVRTLVQKRLPSPYRAKATWRHCQRRFKSDPLCGWIAGVNLTHPLAKPITDSPSPWPLVAP
jgi:hypothetical protein